MVFENRADFFRKVLLLYWSHVNTERRFFLLREWDFLLEYRLLTEYFFADFLEGAATASGIGLNANITAMAHRQVIDFFIVTPWNMLKVKMTVNS